MNSKFPPLKSYKILGVFLSYPSQEWMDYADDFLKILKEEDALEVSIRLDIVNFIQSIKKKDLFEIQEYYVSLFDRSRDLSLYLFEHVHGESRDRGQAMVDLLETYQQQGFDLNEKELPDYLPLFLEFLSFLPRDEADEYLNDCIHIIAKITTNLMQRDSLYVLLFNGMLDLAGLPPIPKSLPSKDINDWMKNIDDEWTEEEVNFLNNNAPQQSTQTGCGGGGCASNCKKPNPDSEKLAG